MLHRARRAGLLRRARARARHRGARRPHRSAHPRVPATRTSCRTASARCSTCRCATTTRTIGVLCAEHVGGARAWTRRRAELRHLRRQPDRRGDGRRGAAQRARPPGRKRGARAADHRHRARRVHRHRFRRAGSSTWNAQAEATFGWTRDEAIGRNLAETIIPPAFRDAHITRHAALSRHR